MPSVVDWRRRPAVVPLPGREPYSCVLCRERFSAGQPVRWGPSKRSAVHDECARKLVPETVEALPPARSAEPAPGPLTLDRWKGEREDRHRGLLLWTMQHPSKRSMRSVARALSKSEATLRLWSKEQRWADRASALGAEADAVRLYRQLYVADFGPVELPEVAANVVVGVGAAKVETAAKTEIPLSEAEEDVRAADRLVREEILRKRKADDDLRQKHVKLLDGGLGYVVNEMQAGRIRASLRDIPTLLQARALLSGEAGSSQSGGIVAMETVRVRLARESGLDVIDALAEDLVELTMIVGVLQTRKVPIEAPVERRAGGDGSPHLRVVEPEDAG